MDMNCIFRQCQKCKRAKQILRWWWKVTRASEKFFRNIEKSLTFSGQVCFQNSIDKKLHLKNSGRTCLTRIYPIKKLHLKSFTKEHFLYKFSSKLQRKSIIIKSKVLWNFLLQIRWEFVNKMFLCKTFQVQFFYRINSR